MERGLKERLVGAAVLAALAVIFIPMLLDDAPSGPDPITETNIPAKPAGPDGFSSRIMPVEPLPAPVELPQPPPEPVMEEEPAPAVEAPDDGTVMAREPADVQPEPPPAESDPAPAETRPGTESAPVADSDESPAPDSGPQPASGDGSEPSGWVIQLGSFSQEDNARDLNTRLREAGYASYVEPMEQGGRKVYRVRVGPEVMRGEAEKVRDRIAAAFDLKGIVVRHQP